MYKQLANRARNFLTISSPVFLIYHKIHKQVEEISIQPHTNKPL